MNTKKDKYKTIFGRKLAELRKEKHLTQPELAEKVGMTRQMISYLEIRAENPTIEQIRKFAEFFGVSADEFIFDDFSSNKHPGKKSRFEKQIKALRNLPQAQKKLVCDMIDAALKTNESHLFPTK